MEILARYKDGSVSHQLWSGRIIEWEGEQCLLDNAIQAVRSKQEAAQNGGAPYEPSISVEASRHNADFNLQVFDNGIGMDEKTRKKAFEPLFTARSRVTGIGLAIVRKIISEHGGQIELETEKKLGCKVYNYTAVRHSQWALTGKN